MLGKDQMTEESKEQADESVLDLTGIFESGEKVCSVGLPEGVGDDRRNPRIGDRRKGFFTDRRQGQRRLARSSKRGVEHAVDPMSIYLREMGTLTLLSHEEELELARMMEEGLLRIQNAVLSTPLAVAALQEISSGLRDDTLKIYNILRGIQDTQLSLVEKEKERFLVRIDATVALEEKRKQLRQDLMEWQSRRPG